MSYMAVLGGGSWGTSLAALLAEKGYDVSLWVHEHDVAREINESNTNTAYLPGVALPQSLRATAEFSSALRGCRYLLNVVPTQFTRSVFKECRNLIEKETVIVSASKGIEQGTLLTVSSIIAELSGCDCAVLSGPSFAREVAGKFPTAVTLATKNQETGLLLQEIFTTGYFRVYTHHDVLGVEIGGALKNVIAIASGISDGFGLGYNSRAALITRGIAEMMRLGVSLGADSRTFAGLSGVGDLVLTCTGALSRNYSVGVKLGQGMRLSEILCSTKSVAEGVATALSAYELSARHNVEMPIVEQVYQVLYKDKDPGEAVRELMNRSLKSEF